MDAHPAAASSGATRESESIESAQTARSRAARRTDLPLSAGRRCACRHCTHRGSGANAARAWTCAMRACESGSADVCILIGLRMRMVHADEKVGRPGEMRLPQIFLRPTDSLFAVRWLPLSSTRRRIDRTPS